MSVNNFLALIQVCNSTFLCPCVAVDADFVDECQACVLCAAAA